MIRDEGTFFGPFGDELELRNAPELAKNLEAINVFVPDSTKGRKSLDRERYCLILYLRILLRHSLLSLPVSIVKHEAPDFLVRYDSSVVALEHTDVGTERSQRSISELERRTDDELGRLRDTDTLGLGTVLVGEDSFCAPGNPLHGDGYVGDEAARELVTLILCAFARKTKKLNESHFKEADRYELLLHDASHIVHLANLGYVAKLAGPTIRAWQAEHQHERQFSLVSLLRDDSLLYDCIGARGPQVLTLRG